MNRIHVLPVNDIVEHEDTDECACGPDTEFVPGGAVITHHSLDGRELSEQEAGMNELQDASREMLDALEALESWEDDFGSESITKAVWTARDNLREALSRAEDSQAQTDK